MPPLMKILPVSVGAILVLYLNDGVKITRLELDPSGVSALAEELDRHREYLCGLSGETPSATDLSLKVV